MSDSSNNNLWSSKLGFILAASGSAVGLGNMWKFPYEAGQGGGGAFVLVYVICVALIGLPLLISEISLGRRGGKSPSLSIKACAEESGANPYWGLAGAIGVLASFLVLAFYNVIGGWSLSYLYFAITEGFGDITAASSEAHFNNLLADPMTMLFWHSIFSLMVVVVVAKGVSKGIEKTVTILMPALFIILVGLIIYATTTTGFSDAFEFLFVPDLSKLSTDSVLNALGQAFFSLSLGLAIMLAYGSHLPKDVSIGNAAIKVAIVDTFVALGAGIAIFSIVFSNNLEAAEGPGLIFVTLPIAFSNILGGYALAILFFFLLLFAAWSSAISVLEPSVERVIDTQKLNRKSSAWLVGLTAWAIGILCIYSFNDLADFKPWWLLNLTFFDFFDHITTNIMLPLGGLGIAIFCGWFMKIEYLKDELQFSDGAYKLWKFAIRYITPSLVLVVFFYNLFF